MKYLFVFLFANLFAHTQTGIINYKTDYVNKKEHKLTNKIKTEFELMEFTLFFNSEKSNFKKEKNIYKDHMANALATSLITAKNNFVQKSNQALSNKVIGNKTYKIDRSHRMTGWELINESVKINDYTCYKAILKEYNSRSETYLTTVAWYTPEIPASYGPIGYGGLPGLILQLETKHVVFSPTSITLNPKKIKIDALKDGEVISEVEMIKLMRKARKVTED